MMQRPPLPDFEKPPVTEVALSMQFEGLTDFRAIHLGLLWQKLGSSQFPDYEEQPEVQASIERFGPTGKQDGVQFQLLEMPPIPRYLFVSPDGTHIVQIQRDRFTVNWRKRRPSDIYPRYETIAAFFQEQVAIFINFLNEQRLGNIRPTQAEVTYVNSVNQSGELQELQKILSVFSGSFTDDFLKEPEEAYIALKFPILQDAEKVGRLYIDIRPEISGDKLGPLKMVLLARGKPSGGEISSVIDFFLLGRKYIVSGFASVTSKEAHKSWGRRDNVELPNAVGK